MISTRRSARTAGFALLSVMVLMTFLAAMITAVVRDRFAQRQGLNTLRDGARALEAAESGVAVARVAIRGGNASGRREGRLRDARFEVQWKPVKGATGAYEVLAVGRPVPKGSAPVVRRLRVGLQRSPNGGLVVRSWARR